MALRLLSYPLGKHRVLLPRAGHGSPTRKRALAGVVAFTRGCRTKPLETGAVGEGHRNLLDLAALSHSQGFTRHLWDTGPRQTLCATASRGCDTLDDGREGAGSKS